MCAYFVNKKTKIEPVLMKRNEDMKENWGEEATEAAIEKVTMKITMN
jgi:hypothetical protein